MHGFCIANLYFTDYPVHGKHPKINLRTPSVCHIPTHGTCIPMHNNIEYMYMFGAMLSVVAHCTITKSFAFNE